MSTPTIVNIRNFDINKLSFEKGKAKAGRMPSINLKYDNQNFQLRLPSKLSTRLWVKTGDDGNTSYTLTSNMKNCDPYAKEKSTGTNDVDMLYNLLVFDLKQKIINAAEENSKSWFGKQKSRSTLEENFKDMYSLSVDKIDDEYVPNGKYAPSFRVKVPVYDNKVITGVVDSEGNPVYLTPDTLDKIFENNMEVNMVVSPSLYVMAGGGFGVTFRLSYAQIFPKPRMTAASIFMNEEEHPEEQQQEEEKVEETTPQVETTTTTNEVPPARKKRSQVSH